jgi:hypothetical protein
MEWDLPQEEEPAANPNDEYAETSAIWLLGWSMVLPFAHPIRLLAYGLPLLLVLLGLSLAFPHASILGGVFGSHDVGIQPHLGDRPYGGIASIAVWLVSALVLAFLLCLWQRDAMRRFKDPIPHLLAQGAAHFPAYCVGILVLLSFLFVFLALTGFVRIPQSGVLPPGLPGMLAGVMLVVPLAWIYARISLLPPLIALAGFDGTLSRSWQMTEGHALRLGLCIIALSLCLLLALSVGTPVSFQLVQGGHNPWLVFRLAGSCSLVATVTVLMWIAGLTALTARRLLSLHGVDPAVFD